MMYLKKYLALLTLSLNIHFLMRADWTEALVPIVYKDYVITSFALVNKQNIWALAKNQTDSILLSLNQDKKSWTPLTKNIDRVEAIAVNQQNILFAFQKKDGFAILHAWNGSTWQEMYSIQHALIGSLACTEKTKLYATVNEKAYELNGDSWRQLGTFDGFREISASPDGGIFARRFNLQTALNSETAFLSFTLELMQWSGNEWKKMDVAIAEKEKGLMSIAAINKNSIACIIREDNAGGKAYRWSLQTGKLESLGTRNDLMTIYAAGDNTLWAMSWAAQPQDRKIYTFEEQEKEPIPTKPLKTTQNITPMATQKHSPIQQQISSSTPMPQETPIQKAPVLPLPNSSISTHQEDFSKKEPTNVAQPQTIVPTTASTQQNPAPAAADVVPQNNQIIINGSTN